MNKLQPVLDAKNLGKTFWNGSGGLQALHGISFSLYSQEFLCVVGPSGCGKTTLLKLLAGLTMPTEGEVIFEGELLTQPRRRMGFVFQQANLMPWRTVRENIALPLELQGMRRETKGARIESMISLVGLEGFDRTYPHDLSGGMAQRVALARALVHDPDVLLLDEPFGSLDALTRERMGTELMRIWGASQVTVVMVTHSISEAILLSDRILVLSTRPGTLRLDLLNSLPRPRSLAMTHTREFGELADRVRAAIANPE
ncbi:MAG: ATP-binding cassette domain-containing protein [Anaerolineales bacterium]|nr:ATP-binding cassette domain-containing protein [Anaerolineales bacterium]